MFNQFNSYYSQLKAKSKDIAPTKVECIQKITWNCSNSNKFLFNENQTWLEQDESRVIQREKDEVIAVKNIILVDFTTLKTMVIVSNIYFIEL